MESWRRRVRKCHGVLFPDVEIEKTLETEIQLQESVRISNENTFLKSDKMI